MRRLLVALGLVGGLLSPASAADYDLPILRGSEPVAPVMTVGPATFTRWSGFYVGGDFSFNGANDDFSSATQPLVAFSLQGTAVEQQFTPSQTQLLGRGAGSAFGFGGFLGYNTQWQDLIIGVEANYMHTSLNVTAPSSPPVARSFPPPASASPGTVTVTSVTLGNANAHLNLTDYVEVRGRAGYVVGNLLPYGFVGFVGGRADYSVSATTDAMCAEAPSIISGQCVGFPLTASAGQSNALLWGISVGGGLDWALTQNFFLRGEFEFIQFAPIATINVSVVNARVGAGFKF
jgi:outer membrane immunogenic protein